MSKRNSGIVLEKVAEYFYYNYRNRNREDVPDMEIPPELCLELLMAADFLDGKSPLFALRATELNVHAIQLNTTSPTK
jgi:hypothetical protein